MGYTIKKAKLPRKRKKVAIKAQGRDWYRTTQKLYYKTVGTPLQEKVCKFWKNSSVRTLTVDGVCFPFKVATAFW